MELKQSSLYDCSILHVRLWPRRHRLKYRFFWFALDLDEAASLPRAGILGTGRWSLYRFLESDHLDLRGRAILPGSLKRELLALVRNSAVEWDGSRAILLTQARFLGYVFNPVSFYFMWNSDGTRAAVVAEVGNTFGELKPYVLGPVTDNGGDWCLRVPKHFYVSPFTDLETEFEFRVEWPADRLLIDVDDFKAGEKILVSRMEGSRTACATGSLLWRTLRFPFVTLQIIFLIHWHALLLFLKRVPYFAKNDRKDLQRGVMRPH